MSHVINISVPSRPDSHVLAAKFHAVFGRAQRMLPVENGILQTEHGELRTLDIGGCYTIQSRMRTPDQPIEGLAEDEAALVVEFIKRADGLFCGMHHGRPLGQSGPVYFLDLPDKARKLEDGRTIELAGWDAAALELAQGCIHTATSGALA